MNLDGGLIFVWWHRVVIFLVMPASIWSSTNPSMAKDDVIREVGVIANSVSENASMHTLISLKRFALAYLCLANALMDSEPSLICEIFFAAGTRTVGSGTTYRFCIC